MISLKCSSDPNEVTGVTSLKAQDAAHPVRTRKQSHGGEGSLLEAHSCLRAPHTLLTSQRSPAFGQTRSEGGEVSDIVRTPEKHIKTDKFSWEPASRDFSEPGLPGETASKRKESGPDLYFSQSMKLLISDQLFGP